MSKFYSQNENTPDTRISRRKALALGCAAAFSYTALAAIGRDTALAAPTKIDPLKPEDGYRVWLRYNPIQQSTKLREYRATIEAIYIPGVSEGHSQSPTAQIVQDELAQGLSSLLDKTVTNVPNLAAADRGGVLTILTANSPLLARLVEPAQIAALGAEGFLIRSLRDNGRKLTLIAAQTDIGTLYGAFALLRLLQTGQSIADLNIVEIPHNPLRILAHSDNVYPAVDRGYSGNSLWQWQGLPGNLVQNNSQIKERLIDYARINASIGLNGTIINKVEADPAFIDSKNLAKVKALADVFRPYGIRLYVSANFASPMALGGLPTADPLDPGVCKWWQDKADEIYRLIPDFGGLEVKVNSEGMTGPQNYGRSHSQGANMLAAAVRPHGGIIMWRAFVYDFPDQNINEDRVKRAYLVFKPLDGEFADNVLVQAKNGPLDFQPREPFHPLFGAMPKTRMLGELQINQEYLGQATHLVYLGTMWQEFLRSDTGGASVARVIEQGPKPGSGGFTATSNVGDDRNWTGHDFAQANWYAYGRLAWDPMLSASAVALEWIKSTWSKDPLVVQKIHAIMMGSHEAYVSYTMPLGLHHMVGGDHYAPMPEGYGDPRGMFHHADKNGIGYDRTRAGSDAVDQYHEPISDEFNDLATCPEKFLLWFHHLPWHHRMHSGRTLWQELCYKYQSGAKTARDMQNQWQALAPSIDSQRHKAVAARLAQQAVDAAHWRDHCLNYFAGINGLPVINLVND